MKIAKVRSYRQIFLNISKQLSKLVKRLTFVLHRDTSFKRTVSRFHVRRFPRYLIRHGDVRVNPRMPWNGNKILRERRSIGHERFIGAVLSVGWSRARNSLPFSRLPFTCSENLVRLLLETVAGSCNLVTERLNGKKEKSFWQLTNT